MKEQDQAFAPVAADKVKIIVATNAAESSITLSDVDIVVCLGTNNMVTYDPNTHRVSLMNTWVSKASATQRAGRSVYSLRFVSCQIYVMCVTMCLALGVCGQVSAFVSTARVSSISSTITTKRRFFDFHWKIQFLIYDVITLLHYSLLVFLFVTFQM